MKPFPPPARLASGDDSLIFALVIAIVGLGILVWLGWVFHHGAVSAVVMRVAHWQMLFIHQFTGRFDLADAQLLRANPESVAAGQLLRLLREIGRCFLYPAMAGVFVLAVICVRRAPSVRYSRNFDIDGLIREQSRVFPAIKAFVRRRLRLTPVREGEPRPGDSALTAAEWTARWASDEEGKFDERMARAELARQLGDPWLGPDRARPHVRSMLAVFALHRAGRREEALKLLGELSQSLPDGASEEGEGPEEPLCFGAAAVSRADYVLKNAALALPVLKTMGWHFFTVPGAMSVLVEARQAGGVLAPAQFAFLKLVDRRLWYALHSAGFSSEWLSTQLHPNPRVEAIGARAHWAAEYAIGEGLPSPAIDGALTAIAATTRK